MKDKIFGVLQRVGRSFMLPIAILPVRSKKSICVCNCVISYAKLQLIFDITKLFKV